MAIQTSQHTIAQSVAGLFLIGIGAWILHGFLVPLAWAVVLAIATYPVYGYVLACLPPSQRSTWGPVLMTLALGVILLGPLTYGLILLGREVQSLLPYLVAAQKTGLPAPEWLGGVPAIGAWANKAWMQALGTPETASETLHQIRQSGVLESTKELAAQVLHRVVALSFALLALYFLYRDAELLGRQVNRFIETLFGAMGDRYAAHAVAAVRSTVNGLVLVGLGEGVLLGLAYAAVELPHAALLGAATGLFAMVPFAAPIIFGGVALYLFITGAVAKAIGILAFGSIVLFVADHFWRPALIGGSAKLPFLWVLLGILGGVEAFGLLGLFLGPTVMAVLISVWRDWTEEGGA